MAEPTVDNFGNTKFTEDFRSEHQFHPQPDENVPVRQSTLKKRNSVRRKSIVETGAEGYNSFLYSPIPTSSNPTETLVSRFQGELPHHASSGEVLISSYLAWRRLLKDYITYFREVQSTTEAQARNLLRLSQTINNQPEASGAFMKSGGILEINALFKDFHKEAYLTAENAKSIESGIITQLTGLRGDLNLKVKEIRALSSDFKCNVEKEKEATKKAVTQLQEAIQTLEVDPSNASGKSEPYIVRLHVENQIRRQLAEENYLHKVSIILNMRIARIADIYIGISQLGGKWTRA